MTVLMINVDDTEGLAQIKSWATQYGLSFPLLNDVNDQTYYQYSPGPPHYIPHNTLVDTAMKVLYTAVGYNQQVILSYINNYYQPVVANEISLSHGYLQMGVDTLVINAPMSNPGNHTVELYAMFESADGTYKDSLMLYDDGNHQDGAAGDGLYGNAVVAPMVEQEIMVGLKTIDIDFNVEIKFDDLARFTTAGPVAIYSCDEVLRVGSRIYYQLELINNGSVTTVGNVQAKISVSDPYAIGILNDFQSFGNIAAGNTAAASSYFGVNTVSLPDNYTFVFKTEIFSNNSSYWFDSTSVVVGLSETGQKLPKEFSLKQNYPNPFNPKSTIEFSIPKMEFVELKIFDTNGKEVETLISDQMNAGVYKYEWQAPESLASGIYYYSIKAGNFKKTMKLVLLK